MHKILIVSFIILQGLLKITCLEINNTSIEDPKKPKRARKPTSLNYIKSRNNNKSISNEIEFKGITFVGDKYCPEVSYESDFSLQSMNNLKSTGANWVAIVVTEYQDTFDSTEIYPLYKGSEIKNEYYTYKTESIEGLTKLINHAHSIGLEVMLKPHIDIAKEKNYQSHWRGDIGLFFDEDKWNLWFKSYENYLLKYANLAEKLQVAMLSISCELIATNLQEKHWRNIIEKVRNVFNGYLVDSANHDGQEFNKPWWDAVDYIGVDGYYIPIKSSELEYSLEEHETKLKESLQKLKKLSNDNGGKEVIITEIGFCSGDCKIGDRNIISTAKDQYIQSYFYESFMKIFGSESFIKGYFWWAWNSDPDYGGIDDHCISPQNKFAEFILTKYYGGDYTSIMKRIGKKEKARCLCTI
jgi:hypothetical protein